VIVFVEIEIPVPATNVGDITPIFAFTQTPPLNTIIVSVAAIVAVDAEGNFVIAVPALATCRIVGVCPKIKIGINPSSVNSFFMFILV